MGLLVGAGVGFFVGVGFGLLVGGGEGLRVGFRVGYLLGEFVGFLVGRLVGFLVDCATGMSIGNILGIVVSGETNEIGVGSAATTGGFVTCVSNDWMGLIVESGDCTGAVGEKSQSSASQSHRLSQQWVQQEQSRPVSTQSRPNRSHSNGMTLLPRAQSAGSTVSVKMLLQQSQRESIEVSLNNCGGYAPVKLLNPLHTYYQQ